MSKTGKQVQGDVYRLLKGSTLLSMISGGVFRNGTRPRDSRKEDIVVTFTAGLPGQVQTGVVTLNIYVPAINPYDNGVYVEDGARCEEIEILASDWVDEISNTVCDYQFELSEMIQTFFDSDINQSFVSVKINFRILSE